MLIYWQFTKLAEKCGMQKLHFYALCTLSTSDSFSAMKLLLRKRIEYHDIQDEITNTYDIISEIILVVIDSQKPSKPN